MPRCPRCHSSMLLQYDDLPGSLGHVWRCLACAHEINPDPVQRTDDAVLLEQIRAGARSVRETRPSR
jgi:hypothetical protein